MELLRFIKSDYEMYEHQSLQCFVAIERENTKAIKAWQKATKAKTTPAQSTVPGFKFIVDPEFDSLKIDFNESFEFDIKELNKVKM